MLSPSFGLGSVALEARPRACKEIYACIEIVCERETHTHTKKYMQRERERERERERIKSE